MLQWLEICTCETGRLQRTAADWISLLGHDDYIAIMNGYTVAAECYLHCAAIAAFVLFVFLVIKSLYCCFQV